MSQAVKHCQRSRVHLPFFPSVTDTLPDYFLNFRVTDFTVASRFHPLHNKPRNEKLNSLEIKKERTSSLNSIHSIILLQPYSLSSMTSCFGGYNVSKLEEQFYISELDESSPLVLIMLYFAFFKIWRQTR